MSNTAWVHFCGGCGNALLSKDGSRPLEGQRIDSSVSLQGHKVGELMLCKSCGKDFSRSATVIGLWRQVPVFSESGFFKIE